MSGQNQDVSRIVRDELKYPASQTLGRYRGADQQVGVEKESQPRPCRNFIANLVDQTFQISDVISLGLRRH